VSYFVERYVENWYSIAIGSIVTREEEMKGQSTVRFGGTLNLFLEASIKLADRTR
jgi:hypothetical protein